jgi:hypothetical protein
MKFKRLIEIVGDVPVFETGLLLAGTADPADVRRQLSRWTKSGRLFQLRRGLYALAPPYQKIKPHPFVIANHLIPSSYVSLQSALAHYGLIPEYVPVTTSVTTRRPARWETPLGAYAFRHLKIQQWQGYRRIELGGGQAAFIAEPEKALLDLIYLQPMGDSPGYLQGLRLQNLHRLDPDELRRKVDLSQSPKLRRAMASVVGLTRSEALEYETL